VTGPIYPDPSAGPLFDSRESREWCAHILGRLGPIAPLLDDEVLLPGEVTHYRRRRHWAALAPPIVDLAAVALLWIALFGVMEVVPSLGALLAFIFGGYIVFRIIETDNRKLWLIVILPLVALIFFGIGDAAALGFSVVLFFGLRLLYRLARWRCYFILYVTDRRLISTQGIFFRQVASMPIARITDISLRSTAFGRMLGYGDFRVESAGANPILQRIAYLDEPDEFHRIVLELTTRHVERSGDPGDGT
jgi:membrane protein YdbS with pleckstrin-like domain